MRKLSPVEVGDVEQGQIGTIVGSGSGLNPDRLQSLLSHTTVSTQAFALKYKVTFWDLIAYKTGN